MSFPHFDLVQRAHSELLAEGKIKQRSTPEETEADKGLLCQRSGFYTYTERSSAIGVLEKSTGNNYQGYSVDILIQTDGTFWDICTDNAGMAEPVNGGPSFDPALIERWRQPSAALAQVSTTPPPEPTPTPPPVDYSARLDALEANVIANDNANTQRIADQIDGIKTQVEESLQKALFLWLRRHEEDEDTGGVV